MTLQTYQGKRHFDETPEPKGQVQNTGRQRFVVQEHHASTLHFDFRLELGGVLVSWAVPKGPSLDPKERRLAVKVEDHPVDYIDFEGRIAAGNYGAGQVAIWDHGTYELLEDGDPLAQVAAGKLAFRLHGRQLKGAFALVQMRSRADNQWLLIKTKDAQAQTDWVLQPKLANAARPAGRAAKAAVKKPVTHKAAAKKARAAAPAHSTVAARAAFAKTKWDGDLVIKLGAERVELTHLDRVYWPKEGITKFELVRYYWRVSGALLPYLKDRPLILKRYPNGVEASPFFQHDVSVEKLPAFVQTFASDTEAGRSIAYLLCQNRATLLYLANLGTIAMHPWNSRVSSIDRPDWMVFDLDPGEVSFGVVCQTALVVKAVLDRLGLQSLAKTSGSRGLHVYVPLKPVHAYEQVAEAAERIARQVADERADLATVERAKRTRPTDKVYIDYLQNAHGKSVASAYSVREHRGATVSAPLDWREVKAGRDMAAFNIHTMPLRLEKRGDLFKAVLNSKQELKVALEKLG